MATVNPKTGMSVIAKRTAVPTTSHDTCDGDCTATTFDDDDVDDNDEQDDSNQVTTACFIASGCRKRWWGTRQAMTAAGHDPPKSVHRFRRSQQVKTVACSCLTGASAFDGNLQTHKHIASANAHQHQHTQCHITHTAASATATRNACDGRNVRNKTSTISANASIGDSTIKAPKEQPRRQP